MKVKIVLTAIIIAVVLAVLFVPFQTDTYKDGGTMEYRALTYRVVNWNRLTGDGTYQKTRVYFFGDLSKSIDELWDREVPYIEHRFVATVVAISDGVAVVEPVAGEPERRTSDCFSFGIDSLPDIGAEVGSVVKVTYRGAIRESYPAGIDAESWEISKDLRHLEYTEQWLDSETARQAQTYPRDVTITQIYSNCFFARAIGLPYAEYKINGAISDEWCVGDDVTVTFENLLTDEQGHMEGDMKGITQREPNPDGEILYDKPVIYLYPEEETEVSVRLTLDGKLTCTYPAYENGWTVVAQPDGTLTDAKGQTYNYLYWEAQSHADYDLSQGFCVKGEDTAAFLEEALAKLGLTRREANEFIVYWLPLMEGNPYNIISFQTEAYTNAAQLEIDPAPDTLIRVFMAWRSSDTFVELAEQELTAPERTGFTAVEWGGTQIKS